MKVKFMSLKGPARVWMLMATVASAPLAAQPPKLDGDETSTTSSSSATSSSSSGSISLSSNSTSTSSSVPLILLNDQGVEARFFDGLIRFLHIPKTAGSELEQEILEPYFHVNTQRKYQYLNHIPLKNETLFGETSRKSGITFSWLREPTARTVSMLRHTKAVAQNNAAIFIRTHPSCISKKSLDFLSLINGVNLNTVEGLKTVTTVMLKNGGEFVLETYWPLLSYTEMFAPEGLNTSSMNDQKTDLCVENALDCISFFGETETFEDSLHRLNLSLGINLDSTLVNRTHNNKTPDTVEKIDVNNPEIKKFFDELLVWEYKIYNRIRAAQRWRIAMPMVQDPDMPGFAFTQFILPQGFDPDMYLWVNLDLGSIALAKFGTDVWKKREYALRHYVTRGKTEGRLFDFSGTPKLDNGLQYPKMSFVNNARWPGLISKAQGLSGAESWGTWSEGPKVTFEFIAPLPKGFSICLNVAGVFGPNMGRDFVATVGNSVRKFQSKGWVAEEITIPFINPTASNTFTIDIPQPTAPASLTGGVGDPRLLGLAFVGLEVIPSRYPELDSILEFLEGIGTSSTSSK